PARFKILKLLKERGPTFVDQIAKETGIHPRIVSHHIDVLQEEKLVASKYELVKINDSKRDVAVRTCRITAKADEVMKDVRQSMLLQERWVFSERSKSTLLTILGLEDPLPTGSLPGSIFQ